MSSFGFIAMPVFLEGKNFFLLPLDKFERLTRRLRRYGGEIATQFVCSLASKTRGCNERNGKAVNARVDEKLG